MQMITPRDRRNMVGMLSEFTNMITARFYGTGIENLTGGRRNGEYYEARKAAFGRPLVAPPMSAFEELISIEEVDVPESGERVLVGTFPMWTAEGPSDLSLKVSARWTDEEEWWAPEDAWLVLPGEADAAKGQ